MDTVRAITIRQPHVAAIFAGLKRYETRTWPTEYRGLLCIHASKLTDIGPIGAGVPPYDPASLGCLIGVVELVACVPTEKVRRFLAWGDFRAGRFAFELRNPRLLRKAVPTRGQLGIWNYSGAIGLGAIRSLISSAD